MTFSDTPNQTGMQRAVEESKNFERITKGVYQVTARDIYGSIETPGIAVFAYGSPGRIEMVGGDSDADIFLVERPRTEQSQAFKKLFTERMKLFDYSKIDMPEWGTFQEIETYLSKSIVEGNQVLETRYLIGSSQVKKQMNELLHHHNSVERELKGIIFNRFYFNQYFSQRRRNGFHNVKYCPGGSRDFLFVYWHDKLSRMVDGANNELSYRPFIESGLKRLFECNKITERERTHSLDAAGFLIELRSDILNLNKHTPERGLTVLDSNTAKRLEFVGYPAFEEIKSLFEHYRKNLEFISNIVWNSTIDIGSKLKGEEWKRQFKLASNSDIEQKERVNLSHEDALIRIALLWGASNANQKELFEYFARKYLQSEDWATIGSIVSSPHCPGDILHHFGTGVLKQQGYGYLLRVVARNQNVAQQTLEDIAADPKLEERYTEVAKAALKGGYTSANHQV